MNLRPRPNPNHQLPGGPIGGKRDDEPAVPALPVGQTTQERHSLEWGHVGINTWGSPTAGPTASQGVLRETFSDNFLLPKPGLNLESLGLPAWTFPGQPDIYEMPWPENPAGRMRSLQNLGDELRPLKGRLNRSDPRLAELDQVADRLLEVVGLLATHKLGVGLLTAKNVLFQRGTQGQKMVLPDLGFCWNSPATRSAAAQPSWWERDRGWPLLWEPLTPALQQIVVLGDQEKAVQAERDQKNLNLLRDWSPQQHAVAVVARVFIVTLLGADWLLKQGQCAVPSEDANPDTLDEVWSTLKTAGDLTVEEFRARLRGDKERKLPAHPLSEFFLSPKDGKTPPPPLPRRWPTSAALAVVMAVLLTGAGFCYTLQHVADPNQTPAGDPITVAVEGPLPADSALHETVKEFNRAETPRQADLLVSMLSDNSLPQCLDPEDRARELWWKEKCRRQFCVDRRQSFEKALEDYKHHQDRGLLYRTVKNEETLLQQVHVHPTYNNDLIAEEQRCLAAFCKCLRWLGE